MASTVAAMMWQFLLALHLSGVGFVTYPAALLPLAASEVLIVVRSLRKARASTALLSELDVLTRCDGSTLRFSLL